MYTGQYVDNNTIGCKGAKMLSRAEWKNLRELYLCLYLLTKIKTKWEIRGVDI